MRPLMDTSEGWVATRRYGSEETALLALEGVVQSSVALAAVRALAGDR